MKYDLHVHTNYSRCSVLSISRIIKLSKKTGILPAITDHNTIKGAMELKKELPHMIVGEEVTTDMGEIIGLFLNKEIKKHTALEEAIDEIHEQGGIVGVPHPFDFLRKRSCLKKIPKNIDFIEICNSRTIFTKFNKKAKEYALKNNLPMSAGSDAHSFAEYGNAYVEINEFSSPKKFLKNLGKAEIVCKRSFPFVHVISLGAKTFGKIF